MSIKDVSNFCITLAKDKDLIKKINELQSKKKKDLKEFIEEIIIPVAEENKFYFTVDEFIEYASETRCSSDSLSQNRSDDNLDSVYGGLDDIKAKIFSLIPDVKL